MRGCLVPDALFAEPRLAAIYDIVDSDRSDLDPYLAMAEELGADTILDIGCGTGTFACLLAEKGRTVIGLDPAAASLAVARRKPGADRVRWVLGDVSALPLLQVDLVTMTGNVAQVFLTDEEWASTLVAARDALRPGGHLVFETRDPARKTWMEWTREHTYRLLDIPGVGIVETWTDLTHVELPLVSFRSSFVFISDGALLTSDSTLCFRSREEVEALLDRAGFEVGEVRDSPDRPGTEFVFMAGKNSGDED